MTSKDYEVIAAILRVSLERQNGNTTRSSEIRREEVRDMAYRFAAKLQSGNPRFNSARFLHACGLERSSS